MRNIWDSDLKRRDNQNSDYDDLRIAKFKNWMLQNLGFPDRTILSDTETWEYDFVQFWLDIRKGNPAFVIDLGKHPGDWFDPVSGEEGDFVMLAQMALMVGAEEAKALWAELI